MFPTLWRSVTCFPKYLVFHVSAFWLEIAYFWLNYDSFWWKIGKNVKIKYSKTQRHILGAKHVYEAEISDDSSAGATCRQKRRKKEKRHPRRRIKIELCTVGGLRPAFIHVKCHPNRLRGHGAVGVEMALPHYFGQWLFQQLVLPYKPWSVVWRPHRAAVFNNISGT